VKATETALTLLEESDSNPDPELQAELTKRLTLFQNREPYMAE
jgi:hypothetical protein